MIMNIPFFQKPHHTPKNWHNQRTDDESSMNQFQSRQETFTERWWEEEGNEPSLICCWEKYHMMIPPSQPLPCKRMEGAKHSSLAVYYSANAACLTGHPDAWQQPKNKNKKPQKFNLWITWNFHSTSPLSSTFLVFMPAALNILNNHLSPILLAEFEDMPLPKNSAWLF